MFNPIVNDRIKVLVKELTGKELNEDIEPYDLKNMSEESMVYRGFTKRQAKILKLSMELGKELYCYRMPKRFTTTSMVQAGRYFQDQLQDLQQEVLRVLCLSSKNTVIKEFEVFKGSVNASVAHPREIFKVAVQYPTARIIVAHNHPSGDPEPSQADLNFTSRLIHCGDLMGIELLDHFIVGHDTYVSLRESTRLFN